MRITKNIREFIQSEVEKRVMIRYEGEKAEAARQENILQGIATKAIEAAREAYNAVLDEELPHYPFLEDNRRDRDKVVNAAYRSNTFDIKDDHIVSNVCCWSIRYRQEVKEKVQNIIVEMELGGNKTELMAMLEKI